MKGYSDLRGYMDMLYKKGLLVRVTHQINKDTEMHPL